MKRNRDIISFQKTDREKNIEIRIRSLEPKTRGKRRRRRRRRTSSKFKRQHSLKHSSIMMLPYTLLMIRRRRRSRPKTTFQVHASS